MKSRHIPYFDFYPADFMTGVRGLSALEVGVYTMLLCRIYEESGPVEYHRAKLAAYCGMPDKTFEKAFLRLVDLGKVRVTDGMVSNPRAMVEIDKRKSKLNSSKMAGKISAEKRQQKQGGEVTPVEPPFNHTDTDKYSVEANASPGADAPPDPDRLMFDSGRTLLVSAGKSPDQAGRILGKWRKDHGAEAVIAAIGRARREGAVDPVAFISGCLLAKPQSRASPAIGERKTAPDGRELEWSGIDGWMEVRG